MSEKSTAALFAAWPPEPPATLIDAIRYRRSLRGFTDETVADDVIVNLLEAARWSSSCYGEEPWRFVVGVKGTEVHAKLAASLMEFNREWAQHAPVLLLTLAKRTFTHNGKPNEYAPHDVGLALGALSAQATVHGLTLHIMAGFDKDAAVKAFDIDADLAPLSVVAIGYPGDTSRLSEKMLARENHRRTRRPLEELVLAGLPQPELR